MNQKAVRIIALVLALIIAGGVLIAAFSSVSALSPDAAQALSTPETGTDGPPVVPIVIGVVAVLLVAACVIIPKFGKK